MLRKSILVLATAAAVGSTVISTSAFAFGPGLPGIGSHLTGDFAAGDFGSGLRGVPGGIHFGGGNTFHGSYSARFASHDGEFDYRRYWPYHAYYDYCAAHVADTDNGC
jgi:hypothetical protein